MAYFEHALQETAARHELHLVDITDMSCIEIDFPADLDEVRELATAGAYRTVQSIGVSCCR
jgi:choline kinase